MLAEENVTYSVPHLESKCPGNVNVFRLCILGNLEGTWSQTSLYEELAAFIGSWAKYIPTTASQTVIIYFNFNAVIQRLWAVYLIDQSKHCTKTIMATSRFHYARCTAKYCWCSVDTHSQNGAWSILHSQLTINTANSMIMLNNEQIIF
jgi:hypothetical protein